MRQNDLKRLCRKLGYNFSNIEFLKQALTHCSAGVNNNERFEFLGDSILNFVIAKELFIRYPKESEGQLSRVRSHFVKGEMLAEIAIELQLSDYLYLGPGELRSGGFRRASILSDSLEAIIAAVYLDGGIEASHDLIIRLYDLRLADKNITVDEHKDPKTQLQEILQAEKCSLPKYHLQKIDGADHDKIFHVTCTLEHQDKITSGSGLSRRKAEQEAAQAMLNYLQSKK